MECLCSKHSKWNNSASNVWGRKKGGLKGTLWLLFLTPLHPSPPPPESCRRPRSRWPPGWRRPNARPSPYRQVRPRPSSAHGGRPFPVSSRAAARAPQYLKKKKESSFPPLFSSCRPQTSAGNGGCVFSGIGTHLGAPYVSGVLPPSICIRTHVVCVPHPAPPPSTKTEERSVCVFKRR